MKRFYLYLSIIVFASLCLGLTGLNWGVPDNARLPLLFRNTQELPELYSPMIDSRNEIYSQSDGSPIGRVKGTGAYTKNLTPVMKTMGAAPGQDIIFKGEKSTLSNFIRPYLLRSYHTDEQMTIAALGRMHPRSLDLNPKFFGYGGTYIYSVGAWYALLKLTGFIKISGNLEYYFSNPSEMGKFFTAGRFLNLIFVALSIILIALITRILFSDTAALIAALFFALTPAVVIQQHIMKPYCMAAFFALACLYFALKICDHPEALKYYALSGLSFGLTVGAMPYNGLIIIAPATAVIAARSFSIKNISAFILAAAFTFALANPYWLFDSKELLFEINSFGADKIQGTFSNFMFFLFKQIPIGTTYLFMIVALSGIAVISANRPKAKHFVIMASGLLPLLLSAWMWQSPDISIHNSRLLLPWIAALAIPAGAFFEFLFIQKRFFIVALLLLFIVVLRLSLASSVCAKNCRLDSGNESTRLLAGEWINENIRPGSSIGVFYLPEPAHLPPFRFKEYFIRIIFNYADHLRNAPEYLVYTGPVNTETGKFIAGNGYMQLKSFKQNSAVLGYEYPIGASHINPEILVFKRS